MSPQDRARVRSERRQRTDAPYAVVVDAYASGKYLIRAFAASGLDVVHVQSSPRLIASLMAPVLEECRSNVVCASDGDIDAVVAELAGLRPVAVVAGAELGVRLADELAERLGLPGNGTALSATRRDKYVMIETLRRAGLRCAEQHVTKRPADASAWAERSGFPVVVKPISSSGADHVYICRSAGQVQEAAVRILAAKDLFEQANSAVLVQSYLEGTEYAVDTVSSEGRRYVCGVWEYQKQMTDEGRRVYDRNVLCDPEAPPVPEVAAYVDQVQGALGIAFGAAHAEVIVTPDGPALVEIAARLNGGMDPAFHDRCLGANQADVTALAYARPEQFRERYADRVYRKRCAAIVHHTSTRHDGVVQEVDEAALKQIAALPSVQSTVVKLAPGRRIRPTVDLPTSPLRIYLAAHDEARLLADYAAIQDLKEQVYRVSR
jgi:biotin carboxylase